MGGNFKNINLGSKCVRWKPRDREQMRIQRSVRERSDVIIINHAHLAGPGRPCSVASFSARSAAERVSDRPDTPGPPDEPSWWLMGQKHADQ